VCGGQQSDERCCLLVMHLLVATLLLAGFMACLLSLRHILTTCSYRIFQMYVLLGLRSLDLLHRIVDMEYFSFLQCFDTWFGDRKGYKKPAAVVLFGNKVQAKVTPKRTVKHKVVVVVVVVLVVVLVVVMLMVVFLLVTSI